MAASLLIPQTEAEFQRTVTDLAESLGWDWMHVGRVGKYAPNGAKGTLGKGWPDLLLVRNERLIFAELKAQTAPPPSTEQRKVLDKLARLQLNKSMDVFVFVWRPSDWSLILEVLA